MIVIRRPPLPKLPYTTIVAGVALTFERGMQFGTLVGVALLKEDEPQFDAAVKTIRSMPRLYAIATPADDIVSEMFTTPVQTEPAPVRIVSDAPSPAASPTPVRESQTAPVAAAALANGWSMRDITGLGRNDDPSQGRSDTSGLTLAEMALCKAPDGWAEKEALCFPWEVPGWTPPGIEWSPAAHMLPATKVPAKPAEAAPVEASEASEEPEPGDASLEVPAESGSSEVVSEPPKPEPETKPVDVLASYGTSEQIAQARAVLKQIATESGKLPSVNKAKYHLEQSKLPKVNAAQLAALLS